MFHDAAEIISNSIVVIDVAVIKVDGIMQMISASVLITVLLTVVYVSDPCTAVAILVLGNALRSFSIEGFVANYADIAPIYAGTLMGTINKSCFRNRSCCLLWSDYYCPPRFS